MKHSLLMQRTCVSILAAALTYCCVTAPRADASSDPASWQDDADVQFALATGHYVRGNYEFAAEELQVFVDSYSADGRVAEARFYLGESLSQLRRFTEATSAYRQYLQDRPQGQHARVATFRVAECLYFDRDTAAETALREFTENWPDDELNSFALAYAANCAAARDDAAGVESYRAALQRYPQSPLADDCRIGLARSLDAVGKTTEAQRIFLALADKPQPLIAAKARYFLARSYFAAKNYAAAETTFHNLLEKFPSGDWVPFASLGLGRAIFEQARLADALAALEPLTDDALVGADAQYWLGMTHKTAQRYATAAKLLLPIASKNPQHDLADDALFHAADALRVAAELDMTLAAHSADTRAVYERLLEQYPTSAWRNETLIGLARLALASKKQQQLERYLAPLYDAPDLAVRSVARRIFARGLLDDGRSERAITELEELIELQAHDAHAAFSQYLLGNAYTHVGRHHEALAVLEKIEPQPSEERFNLRAELAFAKARSHLALQEFESAAQALDEFLDVVDAEDDRRKLAAGELVACLIEITLPEELWNRNQQVLDALKLWRSLPRQSEDHDQLALRVAECLYEAEAYDWAAEVFTENLLEAETNTDIDASYQARFRSGLAWSLHRDGRSGQAVTEFQQLIETAAETDLAAEGAMVLAKLHTDKQQIEEALKAYSHVIEHHQTSRLRAQAMLSSATLLRETQQTVEAALFYEEFLRDYPDHLQRDEALYQSAWLAVDLQRADASISYFSQLHKECRTSEYWPDATYRVADAHFAANELEQANDVVSALLQHEDQRLRAYALFLQGRIAWEGERYDEVVAAMDSLAEEFPKHELVLPAGYFAADAFTMKNEMQAAAKRWESLTRVTDNIASTSGREWSAKIALRHAQTLAALQRWSQAREIAEASLDASPDFEFNYELHFVVGRALASAAQLTDARGAYAQVLSSPSGAKTETAAKAQLMIAETYFHQEDYRQAVREYLKVEILHGFPPWQAAGLFQAGICYEKLGKPDRAQEQYRRLVRDFADTEYGSRAHQRLR
ncbi:MAG: tetratricopeptide repeat protein [Pirellulales bacterium]|nr:tetratricopeptide repeat protein [Pirellulales bacterium]